MARASQVNKLCIASLSSCAQRKVRMMSKASRTLRKLTCISCVLLLSSLLSSLSYSLCTLSMIASSLNSLCTIRSVSAHKKSRSSAASGIAPLTRRIASHASASGSRSSVLAKETPTSVPGKAAETCRQAAIPAPNERCCNFRTYGFPASSWVEENVVDHYLKLSSLRECLLKSLRCRERVNALNSMDVRRGCNISSLPREFRP